MKQALIILSLFFCRHTISFCQTIQFKGQLLQNNVVIRNYTMLIDGKPATTDDAGIFYIPVNATVTQINILPSDQKYIVIYPVGGRTLVPKDASLVTQIIVASFTSNNYLKDYLNTVKKMQDSVGKSQLQIQQLHTQLDSIVSTLHKLSYTDSDLRSAKEIQDGKDRNVFDITKDLEDYSKNAQDLLSAFKYLSDYAFTNSKAISKLSDAINYYNQAYDRLDGNRIFYQKTIADYWSKSQADSFQNLVSFAFDTIHAQKIYPLRDLLKQINDYFNTSKKSPDLKASIQQKISDMIPQDMDLIERFKIKADQFSQSLIT